MADNDDNNEILEKNTKAIKCNGDPGKWLDWEFQFYSKAALCGYAEILGGTIDVPKDNEATSNETNKTADKMNRTDFFHNLSISCSGVALGLVRDSNVKVGQASQSDKHAGSENKTEKTGLE